MSSQASVLPRQSLTARQAETVERLFGAGREVLEEVGHEQLTIRMVAARAGVSPATAYTYLASKDHLFAELFWRLLVADPGPRLTGESPVVRLQQSMRHLAELIAAAPALAAAVTKSLLSGDAEVARFRLSIGNLWLKRFGEAIGEPADAAVLTTLAFAFSGALLQAGMGIVTYEELADQLDVVVTVIMSGRD